MSEAIWYYEAAGAQAGPVGQDELGELIRAGRLAPAARVWKAGMAGWQPWASLPELAALAGPPPVAGPPPFAAPPPATGWGAPPPGTTGTAPFPPNSYAADVLGAAGPGALYPKAPLGGRFLAMLLDGLIASVPASVLIIGVIVAAAAESKGAAIALGLLAVPAVAWALWYSFTKDGRPNGQSIGKKAMGLMVVHLPTNQPCTNGQSALRYLVLFGLNLIPYVGWLVEPIVTLSAAGGQRLGDKAAATQVIALGDYRRR